MDLKKRFTVYISTVKTRWVNFRDAIVLEDVERAIETVQRSSNNGSYIPADFMFVQASYVFAKTEKEKGGEICMNIQRLHPGYDPSKRFDMNLPSEVRDIKDLVGLSQEAIQLRIAEDFLSRLLKNHPQYNFEEFSHYFHLEKALSRQSLIQKLGLEKEDIRKKG